MSSPHDDDNSFSFTRIPEYAHMFVSTTLGYYLTICLLLTALILFVVLCSQNMPISATITLCALLAGTFLLNATCGYLLPPDDSDKEINREEVIHI